MQDRIKIFQIGFNKCGTISFNNLFENYCSPILTSIHWNRGYLAGDIHDNLLKGKKPLYGYESYSVYLDMEYFRMDDEKIIWTSIAKDYFDLLDIHYPNSKFILNTRNIDNWINSRIRHMCNLSPIRHGYVERLASKIPYVEYHKQSYGLDSIDDVIKIWKEEWYKHHDNIITHFTYRPNDLLVFDIEKDPFSKIVDFFQPCGLSFQTDRLPHTNKTQDCS